MRQRGFGVALLDDVAATFESTQKQELAWLDQLQEADLSRVSESECHPGRRITVGEALTQVCLHGQGHRAQCAARLRAPGGEPPPMDYVLWMKDRPAPSWG